MRLCVCVSVLKHEQDWPKEMLFVERNLPFLHNLQNILAQIYSIDQDKCGYIWSNRGGSSNKQTAIQFGTTGGERHFKALAEREH